MAVLRAIFNDTSRGIVPDETTTLDYCSNLASVVKYGVIFSHALRSIFCMDISAPPHYCEPPPWHYDDVKASRKFLIKYRPIVGGISKPSSRRALSI